MGAVNENVQSISPHLSLFIPHGLHSLFSVAQLAVFLMVDRYSCLMATWSPRWIPTDFWQLLGNSKVNGNPTPKSLNIDHHISWNAWHLESPWVDLSILPIICIFPLCIIPVLNTSLISWSHWSSLGLCLLVKQNIWSHLKQLEKVVRLTDH